MRELTSSEWFAMLRKTGWVRRGLRLFAERLRDRGRKAQDISNEKVPCCNDRDKHGRCAYPNCHGGRENSGDSTRQPQDK